MTTDMSIIFLGKIPFQKGDNVIVMEGELKNLIGKVHSLDGETINIVSRDFKVNQKDFLF